MLLNGRAVQNIKIISKYLMERHFQMHICSRRRQNNDINTNVKQKYNTKIQNYMHSKKLVQMTNNQAFRNK